ncbi:MAG: penicillin-binding transpeptidase domain-containing protein [Lachnospiraceae bacterium]
MKKEPKENSSWMRKLLDFLEDDGESSKTTKEDEEIEYKEIEHEKIEPKSSKRKTVKKRGKRARTTSSTKRRGSSRERVGRKKKAKDGGEFFVIVFRILVAIIFFSIAAFGISFIISPREKPEETLERYVNHLNKKEYEQMYEMLDNEAKQTFDKETFVNRNKRIYKGIDATNIKIDVKEVERKEDGDRIVKYRMSLDTLAGKIQFENAITLRKGEERDFDIVWNNSMIFPDLTKEDKVHVSTEPAKRGNILDRNDVVLAKEVTRYKVILDKSKLSESEKESTIYTISSIIGKESSVIRQKIENADDDAEVTIVKLSEDKVTARSLLEDISCITIKEISERVYPYGKYAAHVIGYIQKITAEEREKHQGEGYSSESYIGKRGVERLFESKIRAKDGHTIEILDSNGNIKSQVAKREKEDGKDIKLTIDISTQVNAFLQFQNDKSCTVAINPHTGEVLALASTPTYNTNKFITGFTEEEWKELDEAEENPLYSRYQSVYCPGSSFKPITAAIGLDTGAFTADENFGYTGTSWQKDASWGKRTITTLHDYGSEVILKNALIYSDNIYFARAALKIGGDKFLEKLKEIGFYKPLDFDFSLEASVATEEEDGNLNAEQQLADTGYGQAQVLVNPVHMASIYSAFLNEGSMIRPYLEYKEDKTPTYAVENAFTAETAQILKEDLIQVVQNVNGTGHGAKIYGKTVGGKTGTAELKMTQEDETGTELGWFNAFSLDPYGDGSNDILVISMVEDVKGRGGSGYVVPRVRNILANYGTNVARYANIYESEEDEEKSEWGSISSTVYSYRRTTTAATQSTTTTSIASTSSATTTTSSSYGTSSDTRTSTSTNNSSSSSMASTFTNSSSSTASMGTTSTYKGETASTASSAGEHHSGTHSKENYYEDYTFE